MNGSMPGFHTFTISWSLLKLMSINSVMPSNSSSSVVPFSSCLQSFSASGSFLKISQLFSSGGQSIGASASASVLPMNIQDRFPLGSTGLISLQSKGLASILQHQVQNHQSLVLSFLYGPTLTSIRDYWKNHNFN